ncbi:hypothetical protein QN277_005314 [Acacia crassicarpa]|uniref:Gnk2-homologous domain-containing protein n=1 Tax=Acacia crassicarpa TaxID=499986 RepID=A0AAE1JTA6_9FABA|nr:hypothetical protein QN277_005314 [Acacia crassicarpa]
MTFMIVASFKILSLLFICFLFSRTAEAQLHVYLSYRCNTNKTFATNSAFQSDLTTLLYSLASANTKFYNATIVGGGDIVYGLFMCRGDLNISMCHQCVVYATQQLASKCRFSKEAIVWYEECIVRYSDRYFFSTVDTMPSFIMYNIQNASRPSFLQLLLDTLNFTAEEAANDAKKYATRESSISGFGTMYSLLQCTPDLSSRDCRKCLSGVIEDLPWCCVGKQGAGVLTPSCTVRYELYPFYYSDDQPAAISPPTNSSVPQGKAILLRHLL